MRRSHHSAKLARGMTLLELILALALAGLLLMAVSMALHIHWKAFDVRRSRVEEAQLARALLRHIGDDIRSTLRFEQPDLSGLSFASAVPSTDPTSDPTTNPTTNPSTNPTTNPATNPSTDPTTDPMANPMANPMTNPMANPMTNPMANPMTNPMADPTTGPMTTPDPTAPSTDDGMDSSDSQSTGDATAESGPSVVVGLYGTSTQLQFDISRLPRVDQYQAMGSPDGMNVEIPSDIKTVVYFLQSEDGLASDSALGGATVQAGATGTGHGLMRAESDRAASAWSEMNGSSQSMYGGAKLLAEEVTAIQFQYFDGTEWLTEWNSDDQGGLPVAIEVQLTIASSQTQTDSTGTGLLASSLATGETTGKVYRMVVHLPVGGITPAEETTETTDAMGTSDATGNTSTGDSSGANGSANSNSSNGAGGSGGSTSSNGGATGANGGGTGTKGSSGSNGSKGSTPPGSSGSSGGGKKL